MMTAPSEDINEANNFYMLAEDLSHSLHINDCYELKPNSQSVSVQREEYEGGTDKIDVFHNDHEKISTCDGKVLIDFEEDFSYGQHLKQFDCTVGKASHGKKRTSQQRRRQRQVTISKTANYTEEVLEVDESSHPAFSLFDGPTTQILKSIVSNNNYRGHYGQIIGKGANSVVIYACISKKHYVHDCRCDKDYCLWWPEWYAVKVYKLSEDQMKNEKIFQQVQKEKDHLILLRAKSKVPEVLRCSRNVIVQTMIGTDQETAPSITSCPLKHSEDIYQSIVEEMEMWYKILHLVHGKLSSKNILYFDNQPYYIGWSQSVKRDHPLALKKLMRDCQFITKFFEKRLIPVKSTERLFKDITGLTRIDSSVLSVIHSKDLWKSQHLTNPNRTGFYNLHTTGRNCRFKI